MDCPVCGTKLREIERSGVMIDICPGCKGIWLDRGELEKLLEREAVGQPAAVPEQQEYRQEPRHREEPRDTEQYRDDHRSGHDDHDRQGRGDAQGGYKKSRKQSFLEQVLGGLGGGED